MQGCMFKAALAKPQVANALRQIRHGEADRSALHAATERVEEIHVLLGSRGQARSQRGVDAGLNQLGQRELAPESGHLKQRCVCPVYPRPVAAKGFKVDPRRQPRREGREARPARRWRTGRIRLRRRRRRIRRFL